MSAHLITLKCGLTDPGARPDSGIQLRDVASGLIPQLWSGAKTDFRLILQNPLTGESISVADWAQLTFRLLGADRSTLYVVRNIAIGSLIGVSPRETTVSLTTTETSLAEGQYWISVFATLSGGGLLPVAAGVLNVVNGGLLTTAPAPPIEEPIYTQAQVDALFAARLQFTISGSTLTITNGASVWTVAVNPMGSPATGGISVLNGNGLLPSSGGTYTWPLVSIGAGSGTGLNVADGNALLVTGGTTYSWPVVEITFLPGAPLAQIVGGNLVITVGGHSYSNPAALIP